jgi:membrane dipeptidase
VIFSHSSSKALCNVPRNVPDDILRRMPANGGVVMVAFVVAFVNAEAARITQPAMEEMNRRLKEVKDPAQREAIEKETFGNLVLPPTSIAMVADHIEHIRDVAGVDHVGFGSDFDGNDDWPEGLSDVSMFPNLIAELIRRGWSDADIRKVAAGNVLRALEQAEVVAARLQKSGA